MLQIFFLILLTATALGFHYQTKRRRLCFYASKLDGPPALPLIGSAFYLLGSARFVIKNVVRMLKTYKSPWKVWLGPDLYIVVSEPRDIEIVLNRSIGKAGNYKFAEPVLGEGLFTGPVEKWKRHRKVILTTFKQPILKSYVHVFSKHSEKLVEVLESRVGAAYFDVFPFLTQSALAMTCETTMGCESNERSQNLEYAQRLSKALAIIFMRIFSFHLHWNCVWRLTQSYRNLTRLSADLKGFVEKLVAEKKNKVSDEGKAKSFLELLISLSEESEHWSDEELMEEAQTMVAAGSESIGSSSGYVLMMLGMHPAIQDKVYDEIISIFGDSTRSTTYEDLSQMTNLELVIKETLRLFPLTAALGRVVDKDIVTDNYTLPEGCQCIIALLYTHRDPAIWEDALKFKPQRFTPEEVSKRHPYSYIPFSGGPRSCIGFKYAMLAMKTIISTLVRKYKISSDFQRVEDIMFENGVVLKSKNGYRVALENRD